MAAFSDWTLAELKGFRKELGKAIATGYLRVRYADRDVQYRSLEEMRRTAALLDEEIAAREGTRRVRRVRVTSQKGFAP